jgi:hypothetical protein
MSKNEIAWTYEMIKLAASVYKTRYDFQKKNPKAYKAAYRRGILDEVCSHMMVMRKRWTDEELHKIAKKYDTKSAFQKGDNAAYGYAFRRGLIDLICAHMEVVHIYWSHEMLAQEALKFKFRNDFANFSPKAYSVACNRGILDIICAHMPKHQDQSGENNGMSKWTDELLRLEASKFSTGAEFARHSPQAYQAAYKRGILEQICSHMKKSSTSSIDELILLSAIKEKYSQSRTLRVRKITVPNKPHVKGFDIDIFIPELNRGIEYDGRYHHSFAGLKRSHLHWPIEDVANYHEIKDAHFLSKGIKILHIKEKDWIKNKEECISRCFSFLTEE